MRDYTPDTKERYFDGLERRGRMKREHGMDCDRCEYRNSCHFLAPCCPKLKASKEATR